MFELDGAQIQRLRGVVRWSRCRRQSLGERDIVVLSIFVWYTSTVLVDDGDEGSLIVPQFGIRMSLNWSLSD